MSAETITSIRAQVHHASSEHLASLTKIASLERVAAAVAARGARVVFTKGVFDILHKGHLHLMAYGGQLKRTLPNGLFVVGIPTDRVVKAKKGPGRPINPQQERAAQIAALESVDYVVVFDEPYPVSLIETLRPVYYIKGEDTASVPSAGQAGGEVVVSVSESNPEIPALIAAGGELVIYTDDGSTSTSALVKKIMAAKGL